MTSTTTARSTIKPKTLTLFELCESINNFRQPVPPTLASPPYQYQSSPNAAQILTRRLYLHPIGSSSHSKLSPKKLCNISSAVSDSDQRSQISTDRSREVHHKNRKSSYPSLAVLSSSLPLITRINAKPEIRHSREKLFGNGDEETVTDFDTTLTTVSLNQSSLPSIARGTSSSMHSICTRPACAMNYRKTYKKSKHIEKVDVWNNIDRVLERPLPIDPPSTPLGSVSDSNLDGTELKELNASYNSIQAIRIYKRNRKHELINHENYANDSDHYDYTYN